MNRREFLTKSAVIATTAAVVPVAIHSQFRAENIAGPMMTATEVKKRWDKYWDEYGWSPLSFSQPEIRAVNELTAKILRDLDEAKPNE